MWNREMCVIRYENVIVVYKRSPELSLDKSGDMENKLPRKEDSQVKMYFNVRWTDPCASMWM